MNVATALNKKYLIYTAVMLTSLCENNRCHIDAYILHSELDEEDIELLLNGLINYDITLHPLKIDRDKFAGKMYTDAMWSIEAYYRLMLFDILPMEVERMFYFDVDLIINKSLHSLYNMDFEGNDLIVCEDDCGNCSPDHYGPMHKKMFGTDERRNYRYFNSGMMLMNVKQIREKYNYEYYMKVASDDWQFKMEAPDQDILNYVHWKSVKYVPFETYNLFARIAYYCDISYESVRDKISIIHFTWYKPWDGSVAHFPIEKLWWDYAKKTCFYTMLMSDFVDQTMLKNTSEKQIRELSEKCRELESRMAE